MPSDCCRYHYHVRSMEEKLQGIGPDAAIGGWYWFMIAIFYFLGDVFNTGGITALTFAVYAAFVYLNLRVNFKNDKKSHEILHCEKDSCIM